MTETGAKLPQRFWVQPGRDTVLRCAEGTQLLVPADAFMLTQNRTTVRGPVEVSIQEYYSLADILLNGLGTMAGQMPLETDGMVRITAQVDSQQCALRPDKELVLRFPATTPKDSMRLYTGVPTTAQQLNWRLANRATRPAKLQAPRYKNGEGLMRRELEQAVAYSSTTAAHLVTTRLRRANRRKLRQDSRILGRRVVAAVRMQFEIAEDGSVQRARFPINTDGGLISALQAALPRMARWCPAQQEGVAIRSDMSLTVFFTATGKVLVRRVYWEEDATRQRLTDKWYRQRFAQVTADTALQRSSLTAVGDYVFATDQLGWFNCDRLLNLANLVEARMPTSASDVQFWLVLRSSRTLVPGYRSGHSVWFRLVPDGAAATLVALQRTATGTQLAVQLVTVGKRFRLPALKFQPVNLTELKAEIAKLDQP